MDRIEVSTDILHFEFRFSVLKDFTNTSEMAV